MRLTVAERQLLDFLAEHPDVTPSQRGLAEALGLHPTRVGLIADQLVGKGLVVKDSARLPTRAGTGVRKQIIYRIVD